jgi:hypothetical protein
MSNDVKAWMEAYKLNLMNQIEILRNRISLVNAMLLEFDGSAKGYAVKVKAAAKPKLKRKRKGNPPTSKVAPLVISALEAAGKEGMTAREIAALTELPLGSASSRASLLARDGKVSYDPGGHRYFAIHSTREDNNLED